MSRAAAENEDLAPRAVSCHLCIEAPHSRANEEFDRVRGGRGRRGWNRLYIGRTQYCNRGQSGHTRHETLFIQKNF